MSSVSVKSGLFFSVGMSMLILAGCSSTQTNVADAEDGSSVKVRKAAYVNTREGGAADYVVTRAHSKNATPVAARNAQQQGNRQVTALDRVVWNAQKQSGKMYRYGGESPTTGFDCSGLTQFSFGKVGVALPRTAAEQYRASTKISASQAQKGDLVFFNTRGKRVSHVGIYVGDGKFVHAPRTGRAITTERLDGYWAKRLIGFGRIPGVCVPSYS